MIVSQITASLTRSCCGRDEEVGIVELGHEADT